MKRFWNSAGIITVFITLAVLVSGLAGCKRSSGEGDQKEEINSKKAIVNFYSSFDNVRCESLKKEIYKFEQNQKGIKVVLENSMWSEYWTKLKTLTASNNNLL